MQSVQEVNNSYTIILSCYSSERLITEDVVDVEAEIYAGWVKKDNSEETIKRQHNMNMEILFQEYHTEKWIPYVVTNERFSKKMGWKIPFAIKIIFTRTSF